MISKSTLIAKRHILYLSHCKFIKNALLLIGFLEYFTMFFVVQPKSINFS